jgi:imidazolonepropionase-like amidohydrolase
MPGLIDCHVHFAHWGINLLRHQDRHLGYLAAETVHALKLTLESGCTSARDMGGLDAGFRNAVADGLIAGPFLQTSVTIISPTNGLIDYTSAQGLEVPTFPGIPSPICDGADGARRKVREVLRAGADVIKIATTGGVSAPRLLPKRQVFSRPEVEAIVDEAHAVGIQVLSHSLGGPGVMMAIQAGVDTIEHGGWLDDAVVAEMAGRGIWYVPTFSVYRNHEVKGPPYKRQRAKELRAPHLDSFQRALKAGVRIAMGTDAGGYEHGDTALELELMVEAGMTPSEAIVAGTGRAAECMGIHDRVGTIAAGKEADLLIVDGDPLANLGILRDVKHLFLVLQRGKVVGGAMRAKLAQEAA